MALAGKPPSAKVPVSVEHVGRVTLTNMGAEGGEGCALIKILSEAGDVHPAELVTE